MPESEARHNRRKAKNLARPRYMLRSRMHPRTAGPSWRLDHSELDVFASGERGAHRLRMTLVMDEQSRFVLGSAFGTSWRDVEPEMDRLVARYGAPAELVIDRSTALANDAFLAWARNHRILVRNSCLQRPSAG